MNWIEAILLGLVQGLTEFLPISSSAHLRILGEFLPNASDPGAAFTATVLPFTSFPSPPSWSNIFCIAARSSEA